MPRKPIPALPGRGEPSKKESLLEEAKRRFKQASQASQKQREREREDLKFQTPEHQWDESAKRARLGEAVAGVPTPPRPILSVSKIDHPIQMIVNQFYQAHLGINVHEKTPNTDDETASVIQGIIRAYEDDGQAVQARGWAFDRCVKAGLGYYAVDTEPDDTSDNPSDQRIVLRRILHQESVMFDPSATRADFSDADFAFEGTWLQVDSFKDQYPDSKTSATAEMDFQGSVTQAPEWINYFGEQRGIFVLSYWYKIHTKRSRKVGDRSFDVYDTEVRRALCTFWEVLDDAKWDGHLIPIIPVIGREVQYYDGQRRWMGLIGPNKDAQRLYNYTASAIVEIVALQPKPPFIGVAGQFEGFEEMYLNANVRNQPYLEYRPIETQGGQPYPPPARQGADPNAITAASMLLAQADAMLQAGTSTYPTLGRERPQEKSGKAIQSLQAQGQEATSDFLQNMGGISMPLEARIVIDLIPAIYDRPERILRMVDEDGETQLVMVNSPHFIHPSTGEATPIEVQRLKSGAPRMPMRPMPGQAIPALPPAAQGLPPRMPKIKYFNLREGKYAISVDIGRSQKTMMADAADHIGQLLQANPAMWPAIGPIYTKYLDWPGAAEIGKVLLKIRNQQMPFLNEPGPGEAPTAEETAAQVPMLQQKIQQLEQQLQAAGMAIKTEQAKQGATIQKTQMETASRERIAGAQIASDEQIAAINKRFDILQALLQHTHEGQMADKDAAHEVGLEAEKAKHDIGKTIVEASTQPPAAAIAPPNLNAPPQSAGQPLTPDTGEVP